MFETDKISLATATNPVLLYTTDMNTNFRVIRLELNIASGLKLYVDDLETPVSITPYANIRDVAVNEIGFGDGLTTGSSATADSRWDYVYYQLDLEANPDV